MKLKYIVVGIALVSFLGVFFFLPKAEAPVSVDTPPETVDTPVSENRIVFTSSFEDGTYTLSGRVLLPTPCYQIEEDVIIDSESVPEKVQVSLTTITDNRICIQVLDERDVEVSFEASSDAEIVMTLNGENISLER